MDAGSSETDLSCLSEQLGSTVPTFAGGGGVARLACTAIVTALATAGVATLTTGHAGAILDRTIGHDPAAGMLDHLVQASRAFSSCWMSSLY